MSCPDYTSIHVINANYGVREEDDGICSVGGQAPCYYDDTLLIVTQLCAGKQRCTLSADNQVFQDNCNGTLKYLWVEYTCQPGKVLSTPFFCLERFLFVRSDQPVIKWNARVLKTGSAQNDPAHGSEPHNSPAPVGQSAGIWRVVAGKMYARALDLSI